MMMFAAGKTWLRVFLAARGVFCSSDGRAHIASFFEASRSFDFANRGTVRGATELKVRTVHESRPAVSHSGDSLHTLCRLLRTGEKVGIVNAASSRYVCGGFFADTGKGTQEEFLASITCGLGTSLLYFAAREHGRYATASDGKIKYRRGVYRNKVLCSDGMCLKIEMGVYEDYLRVRRRYRFFSDYVTENYKTSGFLTNAGYRYTVYSVSALDSRGMRSVDYGRLYVNTYNQLATVLIDARLRKIRHMVLTVPGSGVFSNGDSEYKKAVMRAAEDAAAEHGFGLQTIVICG